MSSTLSRNQCEAIVDNVFVDMDSSFFWHSTSAPPSTPSQMARPKTVRFAPMSRVHCISTRLPPCYSQQGITSKSRRMI
jgi:hypothetical protein